MTWILPEGSQLSFAGLSTPLRVLRGIGSGSQGQVYEVELAVERLALKWYLPACIARDPGLERRLLAAISSTAPNAVTAATARAARHCSQPVTATASAPSINPRLGPATNHAFCAGDASKCRTAINSKNVLNAGSRAPAKTARIRSARNVARAVPSSRASSAGMVGHASTGAAAD